MAIKLTTTKESNSYVKLLIYGLSGVGKTKVASTAPTPIIISTEDRLMSLRKLNIHVIKVETPDDFEEAYRFITTSGRCDNFQTVVIDSISDIAEKALDHYKQEKSGSGKQIHGLKAHGKTNDFIMGMIKKFRDIPNKHICFIAKALTHKDETTSLKSWSPLFPGQQIPPWIPYEFDLTCYMQTTQSIEGVKQRVLHTEDGLQWTAKDHSGNLDPIEPVTLGEPTLTLLFNKALGGTLKPKEEKLTTKGLNESLKKIENETEITEKKENG